MWDGTVYNFCIGDGNVMVSAHGLEKSAPRRSKQKKHCTVMKLRPQRRTRRPARQSVHINAPKRAERERRRGEGEGERGREKEKKQRERERERERE